MRIAFAVLLLALIPSLLGRSVEAKNLSAPHVAGKTLVAVTNATHRAGTAPGRAQSAVTDGSASAAETTPSSVSLHQHVTQDSSGQHGHAVSGSAVGGQVTVVDSTSVNQSTASEGTRTRTPDSDGENSGSHGHGHSSSDSGP